MSTPPLAIAAPTLVYSVDINGLVVSWNSNQNETIEITKYNVALYKLDNNGNPVNTTLFDVDATGTTGPFSIDITSNLVPGSSYNCMVIAWAGDNNYSPMSELSGNATVPGGATVPNPPTGVSVSLLVSETSISITWGLPGADGGSVITGYTIYDADTNVKIYDVNNGSATSAILNYSTNTYTFSHVYMKATNSVGDSGVSNTSGSITIPGGGGGNVPAVPDAPVITSTVLNTETNTVFVTWTVSSEGSSPITGYTFFKVSDDSPAGNSNAGTTMAAFSVNTYAPIYIIATNIVGDSLHSGPSDILRDTYEPFLGIPLVENNNITLYFAADTSDMLSPTFYIRSGDNTLTYAAGATEGFHTFSNLPPATYIFYVKTVYTNGKESAEVPTDEITITAGNIAPNPPSGFNATVNLNTESIDFTWNTPEDNGSDAIIQYQIYNIDDYAICSAVPPATNVSRSYITDGKSLNLTQFYITSSSLLGGESVHSGLSETIELPNLTVPNPPTGVVATVNIDIHSIDFTWDAPVDNGSAAITKYNIYGENNTRISQFAPSAGASVDYTLTTIISRKFYMTSQIDDTNGRVIESAHSALTVTAIVLPGDPTGPLPANPKILPPILTDLAITLNWTAVSALAAPVTGYRVTRSDNADFSLLIEGINTKTWNITTGLVAGTPVTFTVASVNANGDCLVPASITVTPITLPEPPAGFVAYVGKIRGTALLYWTPPSPTTGGGTPLTGYVLRYNGIVINLGPAVLTFMVYIVDEEPVTFSLYSKNKLGESTALTATIDGIYVDPTSITDTTIPDPPLNIVGYVGLPGTVYLYWLPQSPINGGTPLTGQILTYNGITMNLGAGALKFFDNVAPAQGITFKLVSKNKDGLSTEVSVNILGGGDSSI